MRTRTIKIFLALGFVANITAFSRQSCAGDINDTVILELSGELATEYTKLTNPALPQNLWVKGSNISRMEAFGFFAFPR